MELTGRYAQEQLTMVVVQRPKFVTFSKPLFDHLDA
jgi:hypothetical protein